MGKARLITRSTIKALVRALNCLPEDTKINSIVYHENANGFDCRFEHPSFPETDESLPYSGFIMEKDENGNNVEGGKLFINMNGYIIKEI